MSFSLENEKFTIFGNGYDSSRNDSGFGATTKILDMKVYSAAIDSSGAYAWFATNGGLKKYSTRTWTEVEQTIIPTNCICVYHPSNVANNYGLATSADGTTAYVFDLTDDTLIATISGSFSTVADQISDEDCILVGDKIYIINRFYGANTNDRLFVFDLSEMTFDNSVIIGGVGCNGFINDSLIFANYTREWFYQTSTAFARTFNGGTLWSNTGVDNNSNMTPWGWTGNGKLYLPVLIDGKWHYGVFDGTQNPGFNPVAPIRYFGTFDSRPDVAPYIAGNARAIYTAYTDGRTKGCLLTTQGVLLTDFNSVSVLSDTTIAPIAMNDRIVICSDYSNNKLHVIGT